MGPWGVDRSRLAFWVFGLALAGGVAYVLYRFVGTFVLALFVYYSTRPIYRRVHRQVGQASLAAAGSLLLIATPALALLGYTVAVAINELDRFVETSDLGPLGAAVEPYLDVSAVVQDPEALVTESSAAVLQESLGQATAFLGFFGIMALHLFLMLAIAFYLLRDGHRMRRWVGTRFTDGGGVFDAYLQAVDRDLHSVFFGNILNAVITGVLGVLVYSLLDAAAPAGTGVPYAALLGLLAGVASLIPVVGMKLVYVPVGVYLFAAPLLAGEPGLTWFPVAFVVVSLIVVDTIPDLVLRPYVSGRSLHVGMVMIAYVIGPLLFGWYGIFLAPLLLVVIVHFARIVLPELVVGEEMRPYAVDPGVVVNAPPIETGGSEPRGGVGPTPEDE
jgi:predicted PurR-regulated permease PerM